MPLYMVLLAGGLVLGTDDVPTETSPAALAFDPRAVAVEFVDQSVLKMVLADERIEIVTPHGRLQVPTDEIRRIEFAQRLPADAAARIDELIKQLASPDMAVHEPAAAELVAAGGPAWLAVVKAAKSGGAELAPRATAVMKKLRPKLTKEELAAREDDLIETSDAKIAGKIATPQLKVRTAQFGELGLKIADARNLRHQSLLPRVIAEVASEEALPDPGQLTGYQSKIGQTFAFRVTGAVAGGSIWGTDVYTTDSMLAMAAVHAGVLKAGETGVVRLKIIASPPSFAGSFRNGVRTSPYGVYGGAYQILKDGADE
ncbi:MAG TPA: LCCL domain-containing protein [Pirellulaceae bacterium]|nr:LCCL domain-containing protein [Pirellulaceae bacterium]